MMLRKFAAVAAVVGFAFVSFGFTSQSYLGRDHLIAQWDGIDNSLDADGNPVHDENATVWKDLTGRGADFDLSAFIGSQLASTPWSGTSLVTKSCYCIPCARDCSNYVTIEVCLRGNNGKYQVVFNSGDKLQKGVVINADGNKHTVEFWLSNTPAKGKHYYYPSGDLVQAAAIHEAVTLKGKSYTVQDPAVFTNGAIAEDANRADNWGANNSTTCLGRGVTGGYNFTGEFCAIRLYDCVLTEEEILHNAAVDNVRFFNTRIADLFVEGVPRAVAEVTPAYGVSAGHEGQTVHFEAPKNWTDEGGTAAASCLGYTLKVDGETVADKTDTSFDYTFPAEGAIVSVFWKWADAYRVQVADPGMPGCSVSPTSVLAAPGDTVTLTATYDDQHGIAAWRGVEGTMSGDTFTFRMPAESVVVTPVFSERLFVATDGDDGASGEQGTPLLTIGAAIAKAVAHGSAATISVGPGEYPVDDTIQIDSENPIRIVSREGAGKTFLVRTKKPTTSNYTLNITAKSVGSSFSGFTITQKNASDYGRVIYVAAGTVSDCVVSNTYFNPMVGQVVTGARIVDTDFIGNVQTAVFNDPLLGVYGGTAERCRFLRNLTDYNRYGEMVRLQSGGTLRNSLVACNTNKADNVAGVTVTDEASCVENCTIAGNVSLGSNTPVGITGGRNNDAGLTYNEVKGTVVNTIIFGNRNATGVYDAYAGTYDHCASSQELSGKSNQRLAAIDFDADWRVQSGPTVDAGKELDWMATGLDLEGKDRVINGVPDLGCYEFLPTGELRASVQVDRTDTVGTGDFHLTASVSGLASDLQNLAYAWTVVCGGQTVATGDKDNLALENLGVGAYTVALTVTSGTGKTATWDEGKDLVVVHPQTVFVAVDSTPKFPYASPATAASDLDMALERIQDGMTVLIGPGTYADKPTPQVGKAITIRSTEGRDRTFFTHSELDLTLLKLANPLASFSGVTFTQTEPGAYCGRAITVVSGTLFDCVVRDCASAKENIVDLSGGAVVSNCVFTCNRTSSNVSHIHMTGGLVANCEFTRTTGADQRYGAALTLMNDGTVRNSLVAFNTNTLGAAGIRFMGGAVESCTVVSNVTTQSGALAVGLDCGPSDSPLARSILNSIVRGNCGLNGETNVTSRAGVTATYTLTEPVLPGAGNIGGDPKFRSARNFRLKSSSPAVDRGLYQGWMDGAVDLDGKPRIYINPTTGEGTVDLGCYESKPVGMLLLVR